MKIIVALPAGGSVDRVARSPADGHTLAFAPASFLSTDKSIFKAPQHHPEADFTPVSRLVNQSMVPVVKDKQKHPGVAALLAAARAAPGRLSCAPSGDGSPQHLAGLMFETRTRTRLLHVPCRGGALAIHDTAGGQVETLFAARPEAVPHVRGGRLHAPGVMGPARSAVMPQLPTMAEAGIEVGTGSPPEDLQALTARDIKPHAELAKAAGLVPQRSGAAPGRSPDPIRTGSAAAASAP